MYFLPFSSTAPNLKLPKSPLIFSINPLSIVLNFVLLKTLLFPPGNVPSGFLVVKIVEYNSSNCWVVNLGMSFGL